MEVSHSHMRYVSVTCVHNTNHCIYKRLNFWVFDQVFQWLFKLGKEIGKSESFSSNGTAHEAATTLTSKWQKISWSFEVRSQCIEH